MVWEQIFGGSSMYETTLTFRTQEDYRQIREVVQEDIRKIVGREYSFLVEVAINEAVNNALNSNKGHKPVTLYIRVTSGNRLIIRVKDQGDGFDASKALEKISDSDDYLFENKLFDESGRGLSIMKSVTDKVIYNRKGNEILLMKHLGENKQSFYLEETEVCR